VSFQGQDVHVTDPALLSAFANLSAVGILGYWLIFSLPAMLSAFDQAHTTMIVKLLSDHAAERLATGMQVEQLINSMDRLREAVEKSHG
jgi:hypothetical protein